MAITFNNFGNCETQVVGSGSGKCDIRSFGDPRGIQLFQKGWSLNTSSDTLDRDTYENQIKSLELFPYTDLYNFEQNTPENEKNTSSTGVLTEIRAGKPQFSFMFDRGSCIHKSLYDKRGKNRWDLGIIFETGVLLARNQAGTALMGFDAGMISVETLKLVQGTDPEMSTVIVQLLDADQFNDKHEFFTFDSLGFNMNRIDGVVETNIAYSPAPTATNTVSLTVKGSCNSDEIISGLDTASFWRIGGTQATTTTITGIAFNAGTGVYTFTLDNPLVANDTVQFELFDTANTRRVIEDASGNFFKGQAPLATIT